MLFKTRFQAGLRDGSIDVTFRRWSRAQVKVGAAYRFDGGPDSLVVESIDTVAVGKITGREAMRAGFETIDDLKSALRVRGSNVTGRTRVYRIAFRLERGRVQGAAAAPTAGDINRLVARLDRMDRLSPRGPWTRRVLALITKQPRRRAGDLAPIVDRELRAFKADVRTLKGMGLTRSCDVGYELTALGHHILAAR